MTDVTRSDIERIVTELIRSPVLQNIYAHDFDARKHKKASDGDYDSERDSDNFEKFFFYLLMILIKSNMKFAKSIMHLSHVSSNTRHLDAH